MNIVIIRQRYNPHGGAERFVSRALAALSKRQEATLHLVARSWEPVEGVAFHRCNPWYLGRLSRDAGFAYFSCKTARALRADLIQSHERLSCCDIYRAGDGVHRAWMAQKCRAMPWFKRWAMQLNPYHLYVQYAERRMFEGTRLRAVICNSQMVKDEILSYFRIAADKLHVIHNGIDSGVFNPELQGQRHEMRRQYGFPVDAAVFLFVGSGFERKGLQHTLEAFAGLPANCFLLVVGRDKHEKRYRETAAALGVGERVRFFGGQPDVKPFYAMADTFVLPTLYDPFSNAVLEAMACGLPVITSTKCGAAELLENGTTGWVCPVGDIARIRAAMLDLCDAALAAQMGARARAIAEHYDWSVKGGELVALYNKLIAK